MKKASKVLISLAVPTVAAAGTAYTLFRCSFDRRTINLPFLDREMDATRQQLAAYDGLIAEGAEWLDAQDTEEVSIISRDGLKLRGYWLPAEKPLRTLVMFHGYRSAWQKDYASSAKYLHDLGCNLLFVDQRAHGTSQGRYITYGEKERFDCVDWLSFVNLRFGRSLPLYAFGISMGAATVLMASGSGIPDNASGIIADCGFTSPKAILTSVAGQTVKVGAKQVVRALGIMTKRVGFDIDGYSTLEAMKTNKTPILFIHGDMDDFVPLSMTLECYNACNADKELLVVEGARHAMSYLVDMDGYKKRLEFFFRFHDAK